MNRPEWTAGLVAKLQVIGDQNKLDRAALAHLQRGLNNPAYALSRVGWVFDHILDVRDEEAAILTASLFAWTKGTCSHKAGESFGKAFGAGLTTQEKQQREKRFIRLIDATSTDLPIVLRNCVALVAQNDPPPLDWGLLAMDIRRWDSPDRRVQKKWSRGFWSPRVTSAPESVEG